MVINSKSTIQEATASKTRFSRRHRIVDVFLAVGGAALGALLHAAVAKDLTVTLAVAVCLVIACALGLLLLQFSIAEQLDLEAEKIDNALQRTDGIRDDVIQVMRHEMMTVNYYRSSDPSGYQRIYDEATKVVRGAQRSIYTLTSYLLDKEPIDTQDRDGKQRYFDSLIDHVRSNSDIEYHRVLQYEEGKALDQTADIQYGKHYLAMDKLKRANVVLRKMRGTRPTTFVIVDGTTLLWQVNAIQGRSGMSMLGMFIITDPAKVITKFFNMEFEEYWNTRSDRFDVQDAFARFDTAP